MCIEWPDLHGILCHCILYMYDVYSPLPLSLSHFLDHSYLPGRDFVLSEGVPPGTSSPNRLYGNATFQFLFSVCSIGLLSLS